MDELIMTVVLDVVAYLSIYLIVTLALNLQYGCTGIPNFGLSLAVAAGAFIVGAFSGRLAMLVYLGDKKLDFITNNAEVTALINQRLMNDVLTPVAILLLSIVLAMLVGAFFGIVASYPAIRLRAEYLMMVLISMGEAMRVIGNNYSPLIGGTLGVSVPNFFAAGGGYGTYIGVLVIVVISAAVFFLCEKVVNSPFGRLLKAVRENETTAECVGKDILRAKFQALVLGSALAALGGALYAINVGVVVASAYNRIDWTFIPWLFMMIGGIGNNRGVLMGVVGVGIARKLILIFKHEISLFLPFNALWLESILIGLLLIAFTIYKPQGFLPERPAHVFNRKSQPQV
jgi:branched-chain amino acid transport system permease protein